MFHLGRCGSSVLASLLQQHRCIVWDGELYTPIFAEWVKKNGGVETVGEMPEDAVKKLRWRMCRAFHRFYGFELKPFHFRLIGYPVELFTHQLDCLGFTHFVILDRKNRLRKILSSLIAHKRKRYHQFSGTRAELSRIKVNTDDVRIDFEAKPLLDYLSDYDKQFETLHKLLQGRKLLKLTYEQDIQQKPKKAFLRICDFLGLQPCEVSIQFRRTNPFPVRDMLINFGEVESLLRGTRYGWMLYD